MLFCSMTMNPQPLHIDAHFCATETPWGKPVGEFRRQGMIVKSTMRKLGEGEGL